MLNKRLIIWLLVISFVASLFIGVNADSFSMVRVTYNGFVAVNGNVVEVYRNGQLVFSTVVGDAPKDVAADGQWLYVLYRDGQMKKWNMMNGSSLELGGGWIGIYTTLNGILGVQSEGLALNQKEYPPRCGYSFVNLTVGQGLGGIREVCNSQVDYIGESGGTAYFRMSHFYILPDGLVDEGRMYYAVLSDGGVIPVYVKLDSDEILEHVWENRCIVRRRLFRYVGAWNGDACVDEEPESRTLIWEGFGLYLDFLGNLRDWTTNETVATGVGGIVDASGGMILYSGGGLGYGTAHAQNVPDIVGQRWNGMVGETGLSVDVESPNIAKVVIEDSSGKLHKGWLMVEAVANEDEGGKSGDELSHRILGVMADDVRTGYGVYIQTGSDLNTVEYASVVKFKMNGGVLEVEDVEEMGELSLDVGDESDADPGGVQPTDTGTLALVDFVSPPSTDLDILDRYYILSTMTDHPEDLVNVVAFDFPYEIGGERGILRVPLVVGSPWGSVKGSWEYGGVGIQIPIYLGYSFQASGKTLKRALDSLCSDWNGTVTISSNIPIACEGGSVKAPKFVVERVEIDIGHAGRRGYWDKATVDTGIGGEGLVYWAFADSNARKFPEVGLLRKSLTTMGEIGVVVEKVMDLSVNILIPLALNEYIVMLGVAQPWASVISVQIVQNLKRMVSELVGGTVRWSGTERVLISRGLWFTSDEIKRMLDLETDPYADRFLDDASFRGYDEFLRATASQSLPFAGGFGWRDWILKVYMKEENIQRLEEEVQNDPDLSEMVRGFLLNILENVREFGWVVGLKVFTELSPHAFEAIRLGDGQHKEIVSDMRVSYLIQIEFYSPGDAPGSYKTHKIVVGTPRLWLGSEELVVDVDPINDLSYTASSATVAQEVGGIYALRDETIWNLRGPGKWSYFEDIPERTDQMWRLSPCSGGGDFVVLPGLASDSVDVDPKGAIPWGYGDQTSVDVRVLYPIELLETDCSSGYCLDTPLGWWLVYSHTASEVVLTGLERIWEDYSADCSSGCVFEMWPGEIIAMDKWSSSRWFLGNVGVGTLDMLDEGVENVNIPGFERVLLYTDPDGEWHGMILPNDVEELWAYTDGTTGDKGFIYNTPEGEGWMFSADGGGLCQLPGRVLYVNGLGDIWVYEPVGVRHISATYFGDGMCAYTELGDEPSWILNTDMSGYDYVDMVDWYGSKYLVTVGTGEIDMLKFANGDIVITATVPPGVTDVKRIFIEDVVSGYGGIWTDSNRSGTRNSEIWYLWLVWGDNPAVGEEAKPYAGHLRNAVVYQLTFPAQVEGRFELKGVYIYPRNSEVDVGVKYRGKYFKGVHITIGY